MDTRAPHLTSDPVLRQVCDEFLVGCLTDCMSDSSDGIVFDLDDARAVRRLAAAGLLARPSRPSVSEQRAAS